MACISGTPGRSWAAEHISLQARVTVLTGMGCFVTMRR
jgi:hypothetical protein